MDSDGDVRVKFDSLDKRSWFFNPAVLKKMTQFSIGQIVRLPDDEFILQTIVAEMGCNGRKLIAAVSILWQKYLP